MANILILGGGFGGVVAAQRLAETLGDANHRITLVSPKDVFTFYPALVRLAFGDCEADDITFDLFKKLNARGIRCVQGEAIKLNPNLKRARITGADFNGEISYDYLIVAMGRRLATEKIGGFFEHAHHLLGTKAARKFGAAVKDFKRGNIVVGLAPEAFLPVPVCETAFALHAKFEKEMRGGEISVSVVFPESIKSAFGGADLHRKLEKAFAARGIKVIVGFAVEEITEKAIVSNEGKQIEYDLLMLVPPFRGQAFLARHGFTDDADFVETDEFLRVRNTEKIYAVGDIAAFPGPKLAFMAVRQAQIAAENLASEIRGAAAAHKIYHHDLAVIIDESGEDAIFLHYGIGDKTLPNVKTGKMWSRMKNSHDQLWEIVRSG